MRVTPTETWYNSFAASSRNYGYGELNNNSGIRSHLRSVRWFILGGRYDGASHLQSLARRSSLYGCGPCLLVLRRSAPGVLVRLPQVLIDRTTTWRGFHSHSRGNESGLPADWKPYVTTICADLMFLSADDQIRSVSGGLDAHKASR
jgi:hypothetical protein